MLFINIRIRYRIDIRKWAFYRRPLLYPLSVDTSLIIFLFSHGWKPSFDYDTFLLLFLSSKFREKLSFFPSFLWTDARFEERSSKRESDWRWDPWKWRFKRRGRRNCEITIINRVGLINCIISRRGWNAVSVNN